MQKLRNLLFVLLQTLGVATCVYLTALHFGWVPCIGSGCSEVLHSPIGSPLGIPLGMYGLSFWFLTGIFIECRKELLGIGIGLSLFFLGYQHLILHKYCIGCHFHAALVLLLLAATPPKIGRRFLGFKMFPIILLVYYITTLVTPAIVVEGIGYDWGKPAHEVLVVGLDCAACQEKLKYYNRSNTTPPSLAFIVNEATIEETTAFVSKALKSGIMDALLQWETNTLPKVIDKELTVELLRQSKVLTDKGIIRTPQLILRKTKNI